MMKKLVLGCLCALAAGVWAMDALKPFAGMLTTSDQLIWSNARLADLTDFTATFCGGGCDRFVGKGFIMSNDGSTAIVQFRNYNATQNGGTTWGVKAQFTQKGNDIYGKAVWAHYGLKQPSIAVDMETTYTGVSTLATSMTTGGYGVYNVMARVKAPVTCHTPVFAEYLTTADQLIWPGVNLARVFNIRAYMGGGSTYNEYSQGSFFPCYTPATDTTYATLTVQLQVYNGGYVKGQLVQFTQKGDDVYAKVLWTRYAQAQLGVNLATTYKGNVTTAVADAAGGYGFSRIEADVALADAVNPHLGFLTATPTQYWSGLELATARLEGYHDGASTITGCRLPTWFVTGSARTYSAEYQRHSGTTHWAVKGYFTQEGTNVLVNAHANSAYYFGTEIKPLAQGNPVALATSSTTSNYGLRDLRPVPMVPGHTAFWGGFANATTPTVVFPGRTLAELTRLSAVIDGADVTRPRAAVATQVTEGEGVRTCAFRIVDDGAFKCVTVVFADSADGVTALVTDARVVSGATLDLFAADLSEQGTAASVATSETAAGLGVRSFTAETATSTVRRWTGAADELTAAAGATGNWEGGLAPSAGETVVFNEPQATTANLAALPANCVIAFGPILPGSMSLSGSCAPAMIYNGSSYTQMLAGVNVADNLTVWTGDGGVSLADSHVFGTLTAIGERPLTLTGTNVIGNLDLTQQLQIKGPNNNPLDGTIFNPFGSFSAPPRRTILAGSGVNTISNLTWQATVDGDLSNSCIQMLELSGTNTVMTPFKLTNCSHLRVVSGETTLPAVTLNSQYYGSSSAYCVDAGAKLNFGGYDHLMDYPVLFYISGELALTGTLNLDGAFTSKLVGANGVVTVGPQAALVAKSGAIVGGVTLRAATGDLALASKFQLNASSTTTLGTTDAAGAASTVTVSGTLSGTGALAVTGTGRAVLLGTQTYSGATMVAAGATLELADKASVANSALTLTAESTLTVAGTAQVKSLAVGTGTVEVRPGACLTVPTLTAAGTLRVTGEDGSYAYWRTPRTIFTGADLSAASFPTIADADGKFCWRLDLVEPEEGETAQQLVLTRIDRGTLIILK